MTRSTPPTIETEQRARELLRRFHQSPGQGGSPPKIGSSQYIGHIAEEDAIAAIIAALSTQDVEVERATALEQLADAEAAYRKAHDLHGDGSAESGRAWDLLRRAGDKARVALASTAPQPEQHDYDGEGLKAISRATVDDDIARMRSAAQSVDEGLVTQEDREAAGKLARATQMDNSAYLAEQGDVDHQPLVQAFRRHRLVSRSRALEEAKAAVRERLFPQNDRSDWTAYAEHRAEACEQAETAIDELTQSSQGGAGK